MKVFRRRARNDDAEQLLLQTRETIGTLRAVLANLKTHLDELEAEVRPANEET